MQAGIHNVLHRESTEGSSYSGLIEQGSTDENGSIEFIEEELKNENNDVRLMGDEYDDGNDVYSAINQDPRCESNISAIESEDLDRKYLSSSQKREFCARITMNTRNSCGLLTLILINIFFSLKYVFTLIFDYITPYIAFPFISISFYFNLINAIVLFSCFGKLNNIRFSLKIIATILTIFGIALNISLIILLNFLTKTFTNSDGGADNPDYNGLFVIYNLEVSAIIFQILFSIPYAICLLFRAPPKKKVNNKYYITVVVALIISSLIIISAFLYSFSIFFLINNTPKNEYCDPLGEGICILPYPSSFYLKDDETTETKKRVNFGPKSLPAYPTKKYMKLDRVNLLDGFSIIDPIIFTLSSDTIEASDLVGPTNIKKSVDLQRSTTILLNVESGKPVPHFVDLDDNGKRALLIMQPAIPLSHSSRFIVIVRGIKNKDGELIEPSEEFLKLISDDPVHSDNERNIYYRKNILPFLKDYGKVQLSWDFVTCSSNNSLHIPKTLIKKVLEYKDVKYEIVKLNNEECARGVPRVLELKFTLPTFLKKRSIFRMLEDPNNIDLVEMVAVYADVLIPCSVIESKMPNQIVQYGHSLFYDRHELKGRWFSEFAEDNKVIGFSSDWDGMNRRDLLKFSIGLLIPDLFHSIPDTIMQSWAHMNLLMREFKTGSVRYEPALYPFFTSGVDYAFYGVSQGAVLGGGYFAGSQYVDKAVFNSPGSPLTLILPRSEAFGKFKLVLSLSFKKWDQLRLTLAIYQLLFDPAESAAWLNSMIKDHVSKKVLIQNAQGDSLVPTISTHIVARAYGCYMVGSTKDEIYGLTTKEPPIDGSAIAEWNYRGTPPLRDGIYISDPRYDNHRCVKYELLAQMQLLKFMRDGVVEHFCQGKCVSSKCYGREAND